MAYDDGFYYGQNKLVFEAVSGNGNTVSVTNSAGTLVATVSLVNGRGSATVPGRDEYTVSFNSSPTFTTKVQCGYGECIKVVLADGYEPVVQKDLDEVKTHLTADDGKSFQFASEDGKYGYKVGADTFIPFKVGGSDCFEFKNTHSVSKRGLKARPSIRAIYWWSYDSSKTGITGMTAMVVNLKKPSNVIGINKGVGSTVKYTDLGVQIYDDGFSFTIPSAQVVSYVFVAVDYE